MTDHELLTLAKKLRYTLTAAQAQLTDLITLTAQLEPANPTGRPCPHCGVRRPTTNDLAEHVHRIHNGPEPDHWHEPELRRDPNRPV